MIHVYIIMLIYIVLVKIKRNYLDAGTSSGRDNPDILVDVMTWWISWGFIFEMALWMSENSFINKLDFNHHLRKDEEGKKEEPLMVLLYRFSFSMPKKSSSTTSLLTISVLICISITIYIETERWERERERAFIL